MTNNRNDDSSKNAGKHQQGNTQATSAQGSGKSAMQGSSRSSDTSTSRSGQHASSRENQQGRDSGSRSSQGDQRRGNR